MGVGRVAGCSGVVPFEWPETLWCVDLGPVPHGEKPMAGWLVNEWMDVCVCVCVCGFGGAPAPVALVLSPGQPLLQVLHQRVWSIQPTS